MSIDQYAMHLARNHGCFSPSVLTPLVYVVLGLVPISVTVGVFFYMAYSALSGVQLLERVMLLVTPPKHHPNVLYVRKVTNKHVCAILNLVCCAIIPIGLFINSLWL